MKKDYKRNWRFNLMKSLALCGFMVISALATAQMNGTYTIDKNSAATSTNFVSFTSLSDSLLANGVNGAVTVNVVANSGPYSEWVVFEKHSGASASNRVTINGNGEKITHQGSTSRSPVMTFSEAEYMTVDDLIIENTTTNYGRCVQIRDVSKYININECEFRMPNLTLTYTASAYLVLGNGSNTSVYTYNNAAENCMITNNVTSGSVNGGPYWGVWMSDAQQSGADDYNTLDNNEIKDFAYYGIRTYYCDEGTVITNNKIHNTGHTNNYTQYGIYAYQYYGGGGFNISNNQIYNLKNGGTHSTYGIYYYGYYSTGSGEALISNNVVDINAGGFTYGILSYTPFAEGDIEILNNTINIYTTAGQSNTSTIYCFYPAYANGDVANNIIYANVNKTAGTIYGIYGFDAAGIGGPTTFTHNNIHLDDVTGGGTKIYAYYNATYATFPLLSGSVGSNWYNKSVSFADQPAQDYRLSSFGLGNLGTPYTSVTTDIEGTTRSTTTPDLGAVEYDLDFSTTSIDFTTLASECGNFSDTVGITIKNEGTYAVTGIPVAYDVNGGTKVSEVVAGPVAAGASVSYEFTTIPTFNTAGTNTVSAYIDGTDDDLNNNEDDYTFDIVTSPTGGSLTEAAVFGGYFNGGTMASPDAVVNTYVSNYDIVDPATATNYAYTLTATTSGGTDVTADGFTLTSSDKVMTVDPATTLAGETIFMEIEVLDNTTGCDTAFGRYLYVPHTPVASFDASDICLGDVAQFKNTSTLAGTSYIVTSWEFDDPDASVMDDNSDIKDGFWQYTTYGNDVNVEMTVANGQYPKFEYTAFNLIDVTPKPEIDFKVLNACEGLPVTIVNSTTLPTSSAISYAWDFGGESTSTDVNPSYTFSTPGQRQITVVASANGCDASLTKNAYQFEKPVASFTSTGECNFVDVDFTNTSTIPNGAGMGYAWDFDGVGISRLESPSYAFATAGAKSVTLTATSEFGCVDAVTQVVNLNVSPEADFTFDAACNLTPTNFTRTGSADPAQSTWTWDFNGESTSGIENPSYLFSNVGTKEVTLTIDDVNGCSNSITKELEVVLQAVADFEAGSVCEGDKAVFTNSSTVAAGDLSYVWSFGDGVSSSDLSPTHVYGAPNTYNVTLEAIVAGGCSDQVTKQVTVNAAPDATFMAARDGRTVVFTGPAGNDEYRWTFGDGGRDQSQSPTYTYVNVDIATFEACLATKKGECWNEACETVAINLVGVEDLTNNDAMINVYPNPSTGKFNVTVENAGDVVLKVADILGNVIAIDVVDNMNGTYSVDMSAVADGVYFVQVKNGDYYATKRITVSK